MRSTRRKYTSVRHTAPLAAVSDGTVERIHGAAQEASEPAEKLQIAALLAALLRQPLHTASPPKGLSAPPAPPGLPRGASPVHVALFAREKNAMFSAP